MKKVLTIAGSDCSGGAGIQADLKTMTSLKVYGMSVITALTAQNTTGVTGVFDASPAFVAQQLDSIFTDIVPDAVKIGMVSNHEIIEIIVQKLTHYQAKNIIVDPVMISTSGSKLLKDEAMEAVITKLIPLADLITPNLPEAESITGLKIHTKDEMLLAARQMSQMAKAVLLKGGHLTDTADDLLYLSNTPIWITGEKINNPNTHGTGCTLSSAIASYLALGHSLEDSVRSAKKYITGALMANLDLGAGSGPLNHCWNL